MRKDYPLNFLRVFACPIKSARASDAPLSTHTPWSVANFDLVLHVPSMYLEKTSVQARDFEPNKYRKYSIVVVGAVEMWITLLTY